MKKQALSKFVDLVISEDHDRASEAIRQWIVESTKQIYESLIHEDNMEEDDLTDEIANARATIEAEENLAEDEDELKLDSEVTDGESENLETRVFDLESELASLRDQLAQIQAGDMDDFDDVEGEASDDLTGDDMVGDEMGDEETDFDDMDDTNGMKTESVDDLDEDEEVVEESEELEEDFDDLEESFNLETVKVTSQDKEGELVGTGGKEAVNVKSPIPQKKLTDRKGAEPVVIKAKEHSGYNREAAPAVAKRPLLKNQVNNASNGMSEKVSPEGDKAAVLNKKDGFGSDSPKSPITGAKGAKTVTESKVQK